MDYNRLYVNIVLRAQMEDVLRRQNKKLGSYYEEHHIVPKSLGGRNDRTNLAMLTAREHFICHWLLVKLYPKGSDARHKMLYAFWRMHGSDNAVTMHRYINSRAYEYLRTEFAELLSSHMAEMQKGNKNSQYGTKWYTNSEDGRSIKSKNVLTYPWFVGRNLFRGESQKIYINVKPSIPKESPKSVTQVKKCTAQRCIISMRLGQNAEHYRKRKEGELKTKLLWDQFHAASFESLGDWARHTGLTYQSIRKRFLKFIPKFKTMLKHGVSFSSKKELIGVYE